MLLGYESEIFADMFGQFVGKHPLVDLRDRMLKQFVPSVSARDLVIHDGAFYTREDSFGLKKIREITAEENEAIKAHNTLVAVFSPKKTDQE